MAIPIINCENFSYTYKGTSKKALKQISFAIYEGECCAVIGPSEAGKTTLCYAISSIIPNVFKGGVMEGRLMVCGKDIVTTPLIEITKKVGILLQNFYAHISGIRPTVFEEIAFGLQNKGILPAKIKETVWKVMEELNILHLSDRTPFSLSGGEIQRVAIASILALDPAILVFDEPTAQLDPEGTKDFLNIIKTLKRKKTIVLVENKLELLSVVADKIIALRDGVVLFSGSPMEVFPNPLLVEEDIGSPIWTCLVYEINKRGGKKSIRLPWSYLEALRSLKEK